MRRRLFFFCVIAIGVAAGCNAIFGIGDYAVVDDASTLGGDGSNEGGEGSVDCDNYDPASGQCYPCAPKKDPEFLNACTGSQCVPFDDKARVPQFNPDGSLPTVPDLPPPDSGGG
jgi:hypothetical protein